MDDRSAVVRLAETRASAAALTSQDSDIAQALARMFESQIPELEREAAAEPAPVDQTAPTLIEQLHPGAVPRFSDDDQRRIDEQIQNVSADDLFGEAA